MLLSEENERLRAELERMKSLAASLLGGPPRELQRTGSWDPSVAERSSVSPLAHLNTPELQEPSNPFQLSLSQPDVSEFLGPSHGSRLRHTSTAQVQPALAPPTTVRMGAFPTISQGGGWSGGDLFPPLLRQSSGIIDFSEGYPRRPPVLGTASYSIENVQAFAGEAGLAGDARLAEDARLARSSGDARSSGGARSPPQRDSQPLLSLAGGLPLLSDNPPPKLDEKFVYPGIAHFEKKLPDHLKPFSPLLSVDIPPAPIPTAHRQLAAREETQEEGGEELEGENSEERRQRSGRKRDRENDESRKMRLSKEQSQQLEAAFNESSTHNPKQKNELALRLGLRPRQVEVWFQNRRARTKLKQTEIDCEVLKRCCETLTEENQRLQRELIALKARPPAAAHAAAPADGPVCAKCQDKIPVSGPLQVQPTESGMVFEMQESAEQHTVSAS